MVSLKSRTKQKSKQKKSKSRMPCLEPKAIASKQTKNQILRAIADETGLSAKQVKAVFNTASYLARCHLIRKGSGEFTIPEMAIKVVRKIKPASKQRQGRNPITGESIVIPAKPKREIIRVRPLKSLKEVLA